MTKPYTDDDVKRALSVRRPDCEHETEWAKHGVLEVCEEHSMRATLEAVAPAIAARALREEACPIVSDSRDQGLGMGAAQRAIWRRADEIEADR